MLKNTSFGAIAPHTPIPVKFPANSNLVYTDHIGNFSLFMTAFIRFQTPVLSVMSTKLYIPLTWSDNQRTF